VRFLGRKRVGTIAEFRKASDNAQRGTELARLIERALSDTDS
jgi:hypothetical protein